MRAQLAAAAVLAAAASVVAPVAPASADPFCPTDPCQPVDPTPITVLDGWGFCSLHLSAPGTDACKPSYVATTPFGAIDFVEQSADATLTVSCTNGTKATFTESTSTTIVHAGKCALFLTTHTAGVASARLRSVLLPQ